MERYENEGTIFEKLMQSKKRLTTEEELILGERLMTIRATAEELSEHINGRKLWLHWIVLPAPDPEHDKYSDGVYIFNLTRGRWEKP